MGIVLRPGIPMTNLSVEGPTLEAIEERLGKATPGPWVSPYVHVNGEPQQRIQVPEKTWGDGGIAHILSNRFRADADFIANAPTDIRYLLDTVKELTQALEGAQALVTKWRDADNSMSESEADKWLHDANGLESAERAADQLEAVLARQALSTSPLKGRGR